MNSYKTSSLEELLMAAPSGTVIGSALAELANINVDVVLQLLEDRKEWMEKLTQADWALLMATNSRISGQAIRLFGRPAGFR